MCSVTKSKLAKITHPGLDKVLGKKTVEKLADPLNLFPNAPEVKETDEKTVQYMSNVWVDGAASSAGIQRNNLRMDLGSAKPAPLRLPVVAAQAPAPAAPQSTPEYPSGILGIFVRAAVAKQANVQTQLK